MAKVINVIEWREIELACVSGLTFKEAEARFNVKEGTIRKRALRHNWPTPAAIGRRAKQLATRPNTSQDATINAIAVTLSERGKKHAELVFEKGSKAIAKSKITPPRNWKDFEIADKVTRRAAGLDTAENVQQTLIQINEDAESDVIPVEDATVLIAQTVEEDLPPSECQSSQSPTPPADLEPVPA